LIQYSTALQPTILINLLTFSKEEKNWTLPDKLADLTVILMTGECPSMMLFALG